MRCLVPRKRRVLPDPVARLRESNDSPKRMLRICDSPERIDCFRCGGTGVTWEGAMFNCKACDGTGVM